MSDSGFTSIRDKQAKRNEIVGLVLMIAGCIIGIALYYRMVTNGWTLLSEPELPWYEVWPPMLLANLLALVGFWRFRHP